VKKKKTRILLDTNVWSYIADQEAVSAVAHESPRLSWRPVGL